MPTQTTDTGDGIVNVVYLKNNSSKRLKYGDLCGQVMVFDDGRQVKKDKLLFFLEIFFFVAGKDLRLDRPAFYKRHSTVCPLQFHLLLTYQKHHDSRRI